MVNVKILLHPVKKIPTARRKMRFVNLDCVPALVDVAEIPIVSNLVEFVEIVAVSSNVHKFTVLVLQDWYVLKIVYASKANVAKIPIVDRRLFAWMDFVTWIACEIPIVLKDSFVKTLDAKRAKEMMSVRSQGRGVEMANAPKVNVTIQMIAPHSKCAFMESARMSHV